MTLGAHDYLTTPDAADHRKKEESKIPAPKDRPDGLEALAFHRGRWRHVKWLADHQLWILGYGGEMILDMDRALAPLPPKPCDAPGFYDFKEPI